MAKNTIFSTKTSINCGGKLLSLSTPAIMGIMNITPDSFYDGGLLKNEKDILSRAEKMISEGAGILDVGGMSSRPGAAFISEEEELQRVIPAIGILEKKFPQVIISIDTWRSTVAAAAIAHGASLVNDISAGSLDNQLLKTVAALNVPYVLMHMKGTPSDMQVDPLYDDVVKEVFDFLKQKILDLKALGIHDIIVDAGFGFGKTLNHNYQLLQHLDTFRIFDLPLLAGVSRKSLICQVLKVNPDKALNGTTVLNTIALLKGVNILRVHDVKEAKEAIQLVEVLNHATV